MQLNSCRASNMKGTVRHLSRAQILEDRSYAVFFNNVPALHRRRANPALQEKPQSVHHQHDLGSASDQQTRKTNTDGDGKQACAMFVLICAICKAG